MKKLCCILIICFIFLNFEIFGDQMRIKIFSSHNKCDIERDINLFLSERKDIKIFDIKELSSSQTWTLLVIYEIKE